MCVCLWLLGLTVVDQNHHPQHTTQATTKSDFPLAERCAWESGDLSGLLLLYTSLGDADGMLKLAQRVCGGGASIDD